MRRVAIVSVLIIALGLLAFVACNHERRAVVYGDSIAQCCWNFTQPPDHRWPALLTWVNRSRSGSEISDWVEKPEWWTNPTWDFGDDAFVVIGTNSHWDHTWPVVEADGLAYAHQILAFAKGLHEQQGFERVIFLRPPYVTLSEWSPEKTTEMADRLDFIWWLTGATCQTEAYVFCLESIASADNSMKLPDELHFSPDGHQWAADQLVGAFVPPVQ